MFYLFFTSGAFNLWFNLMRATNDYVNVDQSVNLAWWVFQNRLAFCRDVNRLQFGLALSFSRN